jgi:simple sugar transport system permease protein
MTGQLPRWVDIGLMPLLNLVAAFLLAGVVVLFITLHWQGDLLSTAGEAARILGTVVKTLVYGSLGYGEGIGFTLFYATNFIFTGLAVAVAFHCGLFNIGGEGQAYVGGLGVAVVCLSLDSVAPWWVIFPIAAAGAALCGAAWAFIPAWLQAKRGSHIVITTIMFNFIANSLMVYLLVNVFSPLGSMSPETRTFAANAHLPQLDGLMGLIGLDIGGAPVNISLFLALACAVLVWVLIWRTRFGYEIRTTGTNPTAAIYAGIPPTRTIVLTMLISGGLAGMMALNGVMGDQHRLQLDIAAGAGFVGIAVALMGRSHPFGIVLASILFGVLYQGGAELAFEIPQITRDMIVVIQALVILFAGALEYLFRPLLVRIFRPDRVSARAGAGAA